MTKQSLTGKKALCVFFLVFLSSCSEPCRHWETWDTVTCYPEFNSKRLILRSDGAFCGLDVSLFQDPCGPRLYADTKVLYFPFDSEQPETTTCSITIGDDAPISFVVRRLEGGQRLLFDDEATLTIINALLSGQCVQISIAQFNTTLIPDGFAL